MSRKRLKLAVISDLHCHPECKDYSSNNTLLFSDKLRKPIKEHPVENLLQIIRNKNIEVRLVLSPGDFTHQSNKQGLFSGWNYVNEITRALKAEKLIATLGNHDIDSRHVYSNYSFDIPKKISQDFPLCENDLNDFWEKGFSFIEDTDFQILVINSTHFHTHYEKDNPIENPAVKGKLDVSQLEEIESYLIENNDQNKIKIALVHHHPIQHSRFDLGEYDFIENGEGLMRVLGKFSYDLIIHGHKHDPWLRYYSSESGEFTPILSSGSFSATNQISFISKFNYFHLIEIEKEVGVQGKGKIETYTFKNKIGWENNKNDGFYPQTGFGFKGDLSKLVDDIKLKLIDNADNILKWSEIIDLFPEIQFLVPEQMEKLKVLLENNSIYVNPDIGLPPKHIYYARD